MSHFTVLVIGDDITAALAPFHEFECTGTDNQYVQDIDITDERRKKFESATRPMVRLADGRIISACDDECYRDPTAEEIKKVGLMGGSGCSAGIVWSSKDWGDGKGYRAKVYEIPGGAEEVKQPFASVAEWCEYQEYPVIELDTQLRDEDGNLKAEYKYGWVKVSALDGSLVKAIDRTNPNAKWDWWELGGRWSGFFKLKAGCGGISGKPGVADSRFAKGVDRCDQARKADIDWAGMRIEAEEEAAKAYDAVHAVIAGRDWIVWEVMRDQLYKGNIQAARDAYHAQTVVIEANASKAIRDYTWDGIDRFAGPREKYLERARNNAGVTFGVLKEGQWYERGEMGWWGCVSNEKDQSEWQNQFAAMLDGLPDDTLLSIVDCHI